MDEPLYQALKSLECASQNAIFALPFKDSPLYRSLKLHEGNWEMGALVHCLSWLRDKAKNASVEVYMEGKE